MDNITAYNTDGCVLALGNFDGIHRGHQQVITTAVSEARRMGLPAVVLTMEPHPRSVLQPTSLPFRLTSSATKERLLWELGVSDVVTMDFTPAFATTPAKAFVEEILLRRYHAKHVVAGHDFVFGQGRSGNMQNMRDMLAKHEISLTEIAPIRDIDGSTMSSSRIREALRLGEVETASRILGRRWSISGRIISGDHRARTLGYPTANMELGEYLRPRFGVYAVHAHQIGNSDESIAPTINAIANIGIRPTLDASNRELLEFHLLNFQRDIYGQEWEVELANFIRPEQHFASAEDLRLQIEKDVVAVKALQA